MLVLTGISDADGYLREGTVVTMYDGSEFVTDGTQYITSGLSSPELADRASLIAPGDDVPAVVYFHSGYIHTVYLTPLLRKSQTIFFQ